MRLLFLTNFYPPASRGGYEAWCQEVAEGLRHCGHEVMVLTSQHDLSSIKASEPDWIRRELHLEMPLASLRNGIEFFTRRTAREQENLAVLRHHVSTFEPTWVVIWGMWNIPRSVPSLAETLMPNNVAYYLGDYWPTLPNQFENYWRAPAQNGLNAIVKSFLGFFAKRILARAVQPDLKLAHAMFPTQFMQDEYQRKGVSFHNAKVIYGGTDLTPYSGYRNIAKDASATGLSLLFAGRLIHDKGAHTAIEAVAKLVNACGYTDLHLTIIGFDGDEAYEAHLHQLVAHHNLADYVTFIGKQPKAAMPDLYRQADVFLFTSIWPEPFGRVIVEAMAAGTAVIGTAVGGAQEIMAHGKNALTFSPGNVNELVERIICLAESPPLRQQLANQGQQTAFEQFDTAQMTAGIAAYLNHSLR